MNKVHDEMINGGEHFMATDSPTPHEREPSFSYAGYQACGGRINETDYARVMQGAAHYAYTGYERSQTSLTADISGVSLEDITSKTGIDPRAIYGILRHDEAPKGATYHHGQMSDQCLLVEALRMLEQNEAVEAIINKHPHIAFN